MALVKLSVVIPCYNEKKRFEQGFGKYYSFLKKLPYPWELILVNDGSQDNTLALMKKAARQNRRIKIASYAKNKGKGHAVLIGLKQAKGQYILFSDIDHSVPISTMEKFYDHFEKGADVVIGSRRVSGAKIKVRQHPLRELLGRGFTLLVRFLIDPKIKDATCGFKAFSRDAAKKIAPKVTVFGWAFDAEVLFLCRKFKLQVAQAPVTWSDIKGTKVTLTRDIIKSLTGLLEIRLNDLRGVYN